MTSSIRSAFYILLIAMLPMGNADKPRNSKVWTERFSVSSCIWSSIGRNDFFVLEPGYQQVLEGQEGNEPARLEITVLDETKRIGNVETRVVEEREIQNGKLVEISRNYFSICTPSNDVFYFGEEVDLYDEGEVTGHEGAWIAEIGQAKAGLFMPYRPLIGARFYQELAPDVAMDRVEIQTDSTSLKTPAGDFHDCLTVEETTPLEPGAKEYKIYAKGVGIIQDGSLVLTKYGRISLKNK